MTGTLTPPTSPPPTEATGSGPDRRTVLRTGGLLAMAVAAGLAAVWLGTSLFSPHLYAGTVLQRDDPAPALDGLVFTDGSPADLDLLAGDFVMVFFGYTSCPDVCPITLATAAQAVEDLEPGDRDRTRLLMVTVDPVVDVPERLEQYVEGFHPGFIGATGPDDAIADAASQYGVFHQASRGSDFDHTASLMGVTPDGTLRIVWPPEVTAEELAADITTLLD